MMAALLLATVAEFISIATYKSFPTVAALSTVATIPSGFRSASTLTRTVPCNVRRSGNTARTPRFGSWVWSPLVSQERWVTVLSGGSGSGGETKPLVRRASTSKHPSKHNNNNNSNNNKRVSSSSLPPPPILFSNNHLLIINKPAGYFSQPNSSPTIDPITNTTILTDPKCLLTKLKVSGEGGGSKSDFLLPMHRLDQPCTGVILLAKNSKAGTRVGNAFRKGKVKKEYYCVVKGDLSDMVRRSQVYADDGGDGDGDDDGGYYTLSGMLKVAKKAGGASSRRRNNNNNNNNNNNCPSPNQSVRFLPLPSSSTQNPNQDDLKAARICHLRWKLIRTTATSTSQTVHLVSVKTQTGAKHQVRAMLSQIANAPVCGDLRYGAGVALPDKSVALHARSIYLPTVTLGGMDLRKEVFVAPIPVEWKRFFSLRERDIGR